MAAIAKLKALLGLDTKEYRANMRSATQQADNFKSKLSAVGGTIASAFSAAALLKFARTAVGASSAFETLNVQFEVLLGSQEKAVAHMKDLEKFSAKTPFSIQALAEASQQLLNFSNGLLGGVESLEVFGDAAAATGNKDLAGMTFWVGRLYASLAANRPIVDSVNALSRLKVVTPQAMKAMIEMNEAGKDASEIWNVLLTDMGRFEGGMEKLSRTTDGATSTMKDNWTLLFKTIGDGWEPAIKPALAALTKLAQKTNTWINEQRAKWAGVMTFFGTGSLSEATKVQQEYLAELQGPSTTSAGNDGKGKDLGRSGLVGLGGGSEKETKEAAKQESIIDRIADKSRRNIFEQLTLKNKIIVAQERLNKLTEKAFNSELEKTERLKAFEAAKDQERELTKLKEERDQAAGRRMKDYVDVFNQVADIRNDATKEMENISVNGRGTRTSQMAQMGGFGGGERSLGIADRQMKLAQERARIQSEMEKRLTEIKAQVELATDNLMGGGF